MEYCLPMRIGSSEVSFREIESTLSIENFLKNNPLTNLEFKIVPVDRKHLFVLVWAFQRLASLWWLNIFANRGVKALDVFPKPNIDVSYVRVICDAESVELGVFRL